MSIIDAYELDELREKAARANVLEVEVACLRAVFDTLSQTFAHQMAAAIIKNARLREAIVGLRQFHLTCQDRWYSCPKCDEGCADKEAGSECNCGADEHNAKIDALLADA